MDLESYYPAALSLLILYVLHHCSLCIAENVFKVCHKSYWKILPAFLRKIWRQQSEALWHRHLVTLKQAQIYLSTCASIFSLSDPVTESLLLCCSWIPSVFCYPFWILYLNGNGLTLTIHSCLTHLSIHSFINFLTCMCIKRPPDCYHYTQVHFYL